MRLLSTLATALLLTAIHAQYGTFDAAAAKAAKTSTLVVVLDGNQTPYDRAVMEAVKSHWKHAADVEFVSLGELAAQPINPERTYLMKVRRTDPVKFEGVFIALVKGWKMKKGEVLKASDNALQDIPATQDLAWIQVDPKALESGNNKAMVAVYVKHLQDYLKHVEGGKITDKATADRLYASRNRLVRDHELWVAQEHLDKSLPGMDKVKEQYSSPAKVVPLAKAMDAVEQQDRGICVSDVVITVGDHRNKHCFKRVFNAGTGELMYLRDDQAIMGKKEGLIAEDLITLTRAR
jgi:hypothetical protein